MSRPADIGPGAPVAVIALGAMFPGRGTTHGFFRDILEGVDAITDVPASHWRIEDYFDPDPAKPDKTYGRRGGFLAPQAFDPVKFGLPPAALPSTDTSQLLALMVADKVMADVEAASGVAVDRSRTSVVLGVASATELTGHMAARLQRPIWERSLRASGLDGARVTEIADRLSANYTEWTEATFPGLLGNVVAGRIANRLDLGGSNYVTDAACASSLSALQVAMHELRAGSSDLALAGGADALNDVLMYLCFSKTPALSPTGDCRPFSAGADGTILGEGIGMLALKRLADAERDGDRIHAVIRGLGGGSDGRATAIYAPLASGQARALRRAYKDAGYGPETVGLVEAHGTGTQAGDKAELDGLTAVFAPDGPPEAPWCALGSVKSQIGHTKAAAGAASLVKAVMALSHRVIPPTIKVDAPNPALESGSPFYLSTQARPWVQSLATPRRASVSSFGFGGSNFHAALEAYDGPNQPWRHRLWPCELFLLSADSGDALARKLETARQACADDDALPALAERLAAVFEPDAPVAAHFVANSKSALDGAIAKLLTRLGDDRATGRPLAPGHGLRTKPPASGKLAFVFAGQGSQYVGMGADLALAFPTALDVWDAAARHSQLGALSLHDKAFPPTAFTVDDAVCQQATLTEMVHAQPAIAVTALSQLAVMRSLGLSPDMAGGHSFGELVALHLGGAMDQDTLLSLSLSRARAMTEAAEREQGAMLAVRASADALVSVLDAHPAVTLANDNGPEQVALSGSVGDIQAIQAELDGRGFTVRRLPVASAFHSPIVAGAVTPFERAIEAAGVRSPDLTVYANATARPYGKTTKSVRTVLANQIRQPVRFREMVEAMYRDGARTFVEFGPGSVVSGLVSGVLGDRPASVIALDHKRRNGMDAFLDGLGQIALAGHSLAFDTLYRDLPAAPIPDPPGKFSVEICGANYGKPTANPVSPVDGSHAESVPPAAQSAVEPRARAQTSTAVQTHDPALFEVNGNPDPKFENETEPMSMPSLQSPITPGTTSVDRAIADITAAHQHYLDTVARLVGAAVPTGGALVETPAPLPKVTPLGGSDGVEPHGVNGTYSNGYANGQAAAAGIGGNAPPATAPYPKPAPATADADRPSQLARTTVPTVSGQPSIPSAGEADLAAALTALIAEKTGYPEEMLDPDMHLEAELGIDSIKQVEILSAIREAYPGLPELEPEDMAELTTIEQIARRLGNGGPLAAPEFTANPVPAPSPQAAAAPPPVEAGEPVSTDLLKSLIAEKTGYPAEMLEDDMDLEAELGVDSIKQVEILSALRDLRPDLPDVDPEQLSELRTIAELAAYFQ